MSAGDGGPYGNLLKVDHGGGVITYYAHLSAFTVTSGPVTAGQVIGAVGATGNVTGSHLHFEVRQDGQAIDPEPWLGSHGLDP